MLMINDNPIYMKNREVISRRYPEMYESLLRYEKSYDGNNDVFFKNVERKLFPDVEKARNGEYILSVQFEGKNLALNSPYNPENEAKKFVEQYKEIKDYSILAFLGFGNGNIANELLITLPKHISLFFYEPSPEVFLCTLLNFDISELLDDHRIYIFAENYNEEAFEPMLSNTVNEANFNRIFYDALPKYKKIFPKHFDIVLEWCEMVNCNMRTQIDTSKELDAHDALNNIYNLSALKNCLCEEELRNVFPIEFPVVIIASGPSLEKNVNVLRELKGKLLLIAVDTALPYLLKNGVRPDITLCIDAMIESNIIEAAQDEDLIYGIYSGVNYKTVKVMGSGRKIFIMSRSAYYNHLFELIGRHMFFLDNGGSVATIAFSFARSIGYTQFVLVGNDCAYGGDYRYAGKDMILDDYHVNNIMVDGYYGGKVSTSGDLQIYLDWFEKMARILPDVRIINSTEGGAKIRGTEQLPLSDILEKYNDVCYDYEAIINGFDADFVGDNYHKLLNYIENSVTNLDMMKKKMKEGMLLIEKGLELLNNKSVSLVNIRAIHEQINQLMFECEQMDETYFIAGLIIDDQAEVLMDIFEVQDKPEKEYERILRKMYSYVADMEKNIEKVKGTFEEVLCDIRQW